MMHVNTKMFVDRKGVMDRVEKKKLRVLSQVGAYSRVIMRRSIRPEKRSNRDRNAEIGGKIFVVPRFGKVIDQKTGLPAPTVVANKARKIVYERLTGEGRGQPPRRGPTDLLRRLMYFGIDVDAESVVIGPDRLKKQPKMVGAVSVPQLLNEGGGEYIGDHLAKYGPHPFVEPTLPFAERKMAELLEKTPL